MVTEAHKKRVLSKVERIAVFDNDGKTYDRYTVVVFWKGLGREDADVLFFGENDLGAYSGILGDSDRGWFRQVITGRGGNLVGHPVKWNDLPVLVRQNIEERIGSFEGMMFEDDSGGKR